MSSVVISGDTSGAITLAAPAVSGTNTATLPAATGTVMVSGNMPAFSAYLNGSKSISASTFTKVQCNTEEFDTNSNYDNATNYRFTPTVAGYYQVSGQITPAGAVTRLIATIYKNGTLFKYGTDYSAGNRGVVSCLVYCNGSTDYLELYGYVTSVSASFAGSVSDCYFQACMVRGA